ncbi:MAG: hypothetical protein IPK19_35245 [Chloroflexi bacterium]|nr:hypothetical protein [Chloroflexota bacterium]
MGEFLVREGGIILSWWLLVTLAGLVVTPLTLRLLGGLPDRGITLARPLGLLLVGFVFWLLAILGFVRNDTGGMALAYAIVLAIGLGSVLTNRASIDLRAWWKAHRAGILVGEILFAVALIVWAIYKAHQNDAFTTEKPMELAFLSGVMRSEAFPPNDPWFAGYAISYYYFGYVIAAMLSTLSGVSSGVGFSMIHALLFALVASSVYGVVYNLVRSRGAAPDEPDLDDDPSLKRRRGAGPAILTGLLGVTFVLIMGNFVLPLVEYPYQTGMASQEYLSFWNMNERVQPKPPDVSGALDTWDYWWWFRAARAISDRGLDGNHSEVIDEFPAFSFVLSDNHPHVLAIPFAALAVGLMLNVALTRRRPDTRETLLYGVVIGGLLFLNTWDGAIYLLGLAAAEGLRRLIAGRTGRLTGGDWWGIVFFGVALLVIGVISVFPFLLSFRSQLAGILPNLIDPTSFNQFFLMFGPLLLVLVPYLLIEVWRGRGRSDMRFGVTLGLGILAILALAMILLAVVGALLPGASGILSRVISENGGAGPALMEVLTKRMTHLPTALLLTLMLALVAARLFGRTGAAAEADGSSEVSSRYPIATGMALLLIALGAALTLAPEFVYLRDNFGTRMNTVFKFYYQAWLVWGVAAAYAVYSILGDSRLRLPSPAVRAAFGAVVAVVLLIATPYLFMAGYFRATVEAGRGPNSISRVPTLDGAESYMVMGGISADDMTALACLDQQVTGDDVLVVQAAGNSYNGACGIAGTLEGIPVLFNWYGHQGQWRGDALGALVGSRLSDIDVIYTEPTWNATRGILAMYGVDYVFVGATERRAYGDRLAAVEFKLRDNLKLVCDYGETQVYRVPEQVLEVTSGS